MKTKTLFVLFFLGLPLLAMSQTIEKNGASPVAGAVCPSLPVIYGLVNVPSSYANCSRKWVPTNGVVIGGDTGPTVSIQWNETPGAKAKLICQFSNCGNSNNGTETAPLEELILSIKDRDFGSFTNSINVDYCTATSVVLAVPPMVILGTGDIAQPDRQEVRYSWTIPAGWKDLSTGITGLVISPLNSITLVRTATSCAVSGTVTVQGDIFSQCGAAAMSKTASISINGVPAPVITPPSPNYKALCGKTSPVIFTATYYPCATYDWYTIPGGSVNQPLPWSGSSTTNTISLTPNGYNGGTVAVKINLNCGTQLSASYNAVYDDPPVPLPVFTSASTLLCVGSGAIYSINPIPNISNYQWSSQNIYNVVNPVPNVNIDGVIHFGLFPLNTSSTSVTVRSPASPDSYRVRLSVRATNTYCQPSNTQTVDIWIGLPAADNTKLVWRGTRGANPTSTSPGSTYTFSCDPIQGASTYTWLLPSGFSTLGGSTTTSGTSLNITTSATAGTYILYCRANNGCGSNYLQSLTITNGTTGGGGGGGGGGGCRRPPCAPPPGPLRTIFPNPASSELTITMAEEGDMEPTQSTLMNPVDIVINDRFSQVVYRGKTNLTQITVPLENLPDGIYYLTVMQKNIVTRKQIVVKK